MAQGTTTFSDVQSFLNELYEGALFKLREQNMLLRTVTRMGGRGLLARKGTEYGDLNPREISEHDDLIATAQERSLLATLNPRIIADQVFISDARIESDDHNIQADVALNLGASFAEQVDESIASSFANLTGGTVGGGAGSALTWSDLITARKTLQKRKVPRPYWCVLHPDQYADIYTEAALNGNAGAFQAAPMFNDLLVNEYQVTSIMGGVIFVTSANVGVTDSNVAQGAMYGNLALAYDERRAYRLAPQRDESRGGGGWELNATLIYAHGAWDSKRGVLIQSAGTAL